MRRCCTLILCMQHFLSDPSENIFNGTCDYINNLFIRKQEKNVLPFTTDTTASKVAVMLTEVLATLRLFRRAFSRADCLTHCRFSPSSLKFLCHIVHNVLYRIRWAHVSRSVRPSCGWATQQFQFTSADTTTGIDEEGRKPASTTAMNFGCLK